MIFFRIHPGFPGRHLCLWRSGLQAPKPSQACIECLASFYVAFCLFVLLAGEKRVLAVLAPTVRLWNLHEDIVLTMCMFSYVCLCSHVCIYMRFSLFLSRYTLFECSFHKSYIDIFDRYYDICAKVLLLRTVQVEEITYVHKCT